MLSDMRLEQYRDAFEDLGYDDLSYLMALGASRLSEVAKQVMMKPGHEMKFMGMLRTYKYRPRMPM